jgi:hypothetical protein
MHAGDTSVPFFSVVLRTSAGREALLSDAIVSLAGQSCQDFEVLLMAQKCDDDEVRRITEMVTLFDPALSSRIEVKATGDGAALAFNSGVRLARGTYVVCLNDDAVAFGHWLECFKSTAARHPGQVLRARVATQLVEPMSWDGHLGFFALGGITTPYPENFDIGRYLFQDASPVYGFAIPRELLAVVDDPFDASLDRGEERPFIIRVALANGVVEIAEVTSLSRVWQGDDVGANEGWDGVQTAAMRGLQAPEHQAARDMLREIDRLLRESRQLRARLAQSEAERESAIERLRALEREYQSILVSRSWKLTRPIRAVTDAVRGVRSHGK